ncbi:MAG: hypothetical protein H6Q99_316 [Proteobacteria bacterium]|nr:hypothetical protein [Pseudomonadota bacterium]
MPDTEDDLPDAEPSLSALLNVVRDLTGGGPGWDGIEPSSQSLEKMRRAQQAAMRQQAMAFRDCFETEAGRIVLETLLNETLRKAPDVVNFDGPLEKLALQLACREAVNAFVFGILQAIAQADGNQLEGRDHA